MIRLDTVRLRLNESAARLHARRLTSHPETENKDLRRSKRPRHFATLSAAENLGPGFGRIQWDRLAGVVSLDFSAKVLADLYPDGITADNLDAAAVALNRSGLVDLDGDTLAGAFVQWADAAVNLPVGRDALADDFAALRVLRTNPRHRFTDQAVRGRSLTWKGSKGKHLNAYDWEANLWKPEQADFMRTLSRDTRRRFEGVARFERQARGPARVRHYLAHAVRGPYAELSQVLASTRSPVAELFDDVRGETGQRELFLPSGRAGGAVRHGAGQAASGAPVPPDRIGERV